MGLLEQIGALFRADAAPAPFVLPGPSLPTERRSDSTFNPFTGSGGVGDKGAVARPTVGIPLSPWELRALYKCNGIGRRIVDLLPQRATRRGWTLPEVGGDDARLMVHDVVRDAMTWSRLYGDSPLLLVTEDDIPPEFRSNPRLWLQQPLDLERVGRVDALHAFDGIESHPLAWDQNVRSPTFGMPLLWNLHREGWQATVHASRVVLFRGARRSPSERTTGWSGSTMPDDSILQPIWDEIRRLTETMQGGATLAAELRQSVFHIDGFETLRTSDQDAQFMGKMSTMNKMKGVFNALVMGTKDRYESTAQAPTGFKDLSQEAKNMLSAVTGIPEVILFGTAPSGLNADGASSQEGFRQLVSDYQEQNRCNIERIGEVVRAAQDGPTGGDALDPEEASLVFHPLDEPSEKEVAEVRKTVAEADKIYVDLGVYRAQDVTASRFSDEGYSFEMLPVEILEEPEPEPEPDPIPVPTPNNGGDE